MPDPIHDYEQVSVYALDDAQREELLRSHAECTFNWSTRDGWPMGVVTGKSITAKGRCSVHEDVETKAWFYLERERARRGLAQEKR